MTVPAADRVDGLSRSTAEGRAALAERVQSLRLPRQETRPANAWLPWTLCVLLAGATAFFALRGAAPSSTTDVANATVAATEARPSGFSTASAPPPSEVSNNGNNIALESKGYIVPAHQILVSPKVSGMVTRLHIEEGQRVKKGEVLAEIEDIEYAAEYGRALANLELTKHRYDELRNGSRELEKSQSKAELLEAESQLPQLEADFRRNDRLRNTNSLAIRELEQAESSYRAMAARVARLRATHGLIVEGPRLERVHAAAAEVDVAAAEVTRAKWRLDNCNVIAPVSGTILKKSAEEGNIVNAIAFNGSFSLCEMANLADLEVDLSIQERDVARVMVGQKCKVRADAYPRRVYDGVVDRLMPIADRAKGAIPVRVKLTVPADEEGVYLKPEMGAVVQFLTSESEGKQSDGMHGAPAPAAVPAVDGSSKENKADVAK